MNKLHSLNILQDHNIKISAMATMVKKGAEQGNFYIAFPDISDSRKERHSLHNIINATQCC